MCAPRYPRLTRVLRCRALLKHFTTDEIAPWPLPEQNELDAFVEAVPGDWAAEFHKRVVQHNIRIIAKYYQRIRFARFAQLINQTAEVRCVGAPRPPFLRSSH